MPELKCGLCGGVNDVRPVTGGAICDACQRRADLLEHSTLALTGISQARRYTSFVANHANFLYKRLDLHDWPQYQMENLDIAETELNEALRQFTLLRAAIERFVGGND